MSTKTTFKRVALVTVAALGLGVLTSVAPATAIDSSVTVSTFTSSLSLSHTSATLVGATQATTSSAIFQVTAIGNNGQSAALFNTGPGETITATVIGVPAASTINATPATTNLFITPVKGDYSAGFTSAASGSTTAGAGAATISSATASTSSIDNARIAAGAQPTTNGVYYFAVSPNSGGTQAIDAGIYTIRIRLTDNTGFSTSYNVSVNFVTSAADSGAVIVPTVTGRYVVGESSITYTTDRNMSATIRNADGGRLFVAGSTAFTPTAPVLAAALTKSTGVLRAEAMTIADSGVAAVDHVAISTATAATVASTTTVVNAAVTAATKEAANVLVKTLDGTYGITSAATLLAGTVTTGDLLRVRYGATSATASLTIATIGTATIATSTSVTATGQAIVEAAPLTVTTVPLTATTVTYKAKGGTPGFPYVATVSYTNVAAGDQSPVGDTPTIVYADSSGDIVVTIKNANPIDGASATVNLTGFVTTNPADRVINYTKSKAATVSVSLNGAYFALKSANTFTATVTDAFGAVVAGVLLSPVVSGSNADVTSRATVTTDAKGQATITLTDAAAVAAGTDTVTFTEVGKTITGSATITYAATTPVAATLTSYYSATVAATAAAITTPTPSTGIYVLGTTKFDLGNTRDTSMVVTPTDGQQLVIKISTGVAGAAVKAEATTKGAYVLSSVALEASSRTRYTSSLGEVLFQVGTHTPGANVITFTSGTVSTTVAFWGASATAARFITLTGPATLNANGAAGSYSAAVTDRFDNPVSGVTLSISATGVAILGGGATLASFTTDSTGTFTFQGTSVVAAGGAGSFKVTAGTSTDFASLAGKVDSASVNSTLAAGNNSATAAVTFAAGENVAEANAQAATDAAAEATDAANAATDAANAAAEAADAATAAAQDAADAVAALSAQVATLISGLKAQLTALTNLVIKIQKKVKA